MFVPFKWFFVTVGLVGKLIGQDSSKEYSVKSAANADGITVSGELKTVLGTTLGLMDAASLDNTKFQSEAYKAANWINSTNEKPLLFIFFSISHSPFLIN